MRSLCRDLAYVVLALLALPRLLAKDRGDWPARFGKGPPLPKADRPRVLLAAVSVGEVNLLRGITGELADADVVIASTTDTGYARAVELFGDRFPVVRYPLDFSWSVRRFLDRVQPDAVALAELELWPGFLETCARRGIPVGVINGRMSDRSAPRYRRFRFITGGWFRRLAVVAAQDERSAERFREAGARDVRVTGNMKWDAAGAAPGEATIEETARRLGIDRSRPVVVAGSTAPDEVELIANAVGDRAQLVVAPRRMEWFDDAAAKLPGCARWSRPDEVGVGRGRAVLDVIGRLPAAYALADVVIVGRSFGGLHGSDPMEPASLGKPVLIGPAHADFVSAVEALRGAGGLRVVERRELARAVGELLESAERRTGMGEAAHAAAEQMRGASARNAAIVRELLALSPAGRDRR